MLIFVFSWLNRDMFKIKRKVKSLLYARIIAADYDNIFKLASMAAKNIYKLSPAAMYWNIIIRHFELNFAWQILPPYISNPRK